MAEPPPRPGPPRPGRRPARARARPRGRGPGRRHARPRRAHRGRADALPAGPRGRHRPRPRGPRARRRAAARRSATGSPACTPSTTRSPTCSPTSASTRSTRVLFDLGVSSMQLDVARARLRLRRGRAARHADGRHAPGMTAADVLNTYSARRPDPDPPEYGEEKFARKIAARRRARARAGAVHDLGPPRRAAVRRDPGAGAAYRRPPRQAHLPGAADGGQRRAGRAAPGASPRPSTRSPSAAGWSWSPTTRWRTGWSSRRSPPRPRADVPADLPFVPEGHEPALRLVTRGAEKADRGRDRPRTRAPPRCGCARSNASDERSSCMSTSAPPSSARACRGSPRPPSSGPG